MKTEKKGKPKIVERSTETAAQNDSDEMAAAVDTLQSETGGIDKIRNILFGSQMADYEQRFVQLEDRLASRIVALDQKIAQQIKTLESTIKEQDTALARRLDSEQSERSQGADTLSREIVAAKDEVSNSVDALALQQVREIEAVNKELKTMSNDLSDEIHIQQVEAAKNLDSAIGALEEDKLARKALSQLFLEMAGRLSEEQD